MYAFWNDRSTSTDVWLQWNILRVLQAVDRVVRNRYPSLMVLALAKVKLAKPNR
jgi:hypothetical protein